jgi:hypothetical protein
VLTVAVDPLNRLCLTLLCCCLLYILQIAAAQWYHSPVAPWLAQLPLSPHTHLTCYAPHWRRKASQRYAFFWPTRRKERSRRTTCQSGRRVVVVGSNGNIKDVRHLPDIVPDNLGHVSVCKWCLSSLCCWRMLLRARCCCCCCLPAAFDGCCSSCCCSAVQVYKGMTSAARAIYREHGLPGLYRCG